MEIQALRIQEQHVVLGSACLGLGSLGFIYIYIHTLYILYTVYILYILDMLDILYILYITLYIYISLGGSRCLLWRGLGSWLLFCAVWVYSRGQRKTVFPQSLLRVS